MKSEETRNRLRSGLRALGSGRAASAGVAALRAASVAPLRAATAALLLGAASVLWGCSKESPAGGASGACPGEASDVRVTLSLASDGPLHAVDKDATGAHGAAAPTPGTASDPVCAAGASATRGVVNPSIVDEWAVSDLWVDVYKRQVSNRTVTFQYLWNGTWTRIDGRTQLPTPQITKAALSPEGIISGVGEDMYITLWGAIPMNGVNIRARVGTTVVASNVVTGTEMCIRDRRSSRAKSPLRVRPSR